MLKTLDPHSVFLPEQRAQQMDEQFHGEYSGIGVQFDIQDNKIVVISPLEGTPAYRLGIRAGDKIIEIDGKPLKKGINNDDVFHALRGPTGSTVGCHDRARGRAGAACTSRSSAPRSRSRAFPTPT